MQALKKDGKTLYLFDDTETVTLGDQGVAVGDPARYTIADITSANGELVAVSSPPFDWPGTQDIIDQIQVDIQKRLDDFAGTRNYESITSLATYATSLNQKFKAEGQYGVELRDATWAKGYEILGDVAAGLRPVPLSFAEIESEFPIPAWPN